MPSYYGDAMQVALAAMSAALTIVSVKAYRKRPEGRYLLLMIAFASFSIASVLNASLVLFTGWGPSFFPIFSLYAVPALELLMVTSFLVALVWSSRLGKRFAAICIAVVLSVGLAATTAYVADTNSSNNQSVLPSGCVRQPGGFLIIASSLGYNDSIAHGAPVKSWPVLDVTKGTEVRITVCNMYTAPVGLQVSHYLATPIETALPGQVLSLSFVADQTGSFVIYCSTFNPIHVYLQGGELNVI